MLDFAVKVAERSHEIDDADYEALKSHGFQRRRRLGHRRDRRHVRDVEPARQRLLDSAERRILRDGPREQELSERVFTVSAPSGPGVGNEFYVIGQESR